MLVSTQDLERAGVLRDAFRAHGFAVELVTPDEVLTPVEGTVLLVLTGAWRPELEPPLLRQARERGDLPVMAYLAEGASAPAELPPGVNELLSPGASAEEVVLVARRLLGRHRLQEATGIVGETDAMREVMERVVQIAPVASTVLITGESGTGKELVARGLHALSPRRHKPFMAVNVAAVADTLLESELFGHEKGAFTGAIDARRGYFELANSGTLFLDEIGEMPLATQTKLLRVLEERELLRVGGERTVKVDVRIIVATNRDLRQMVALGEFRKDLYYRLNVLHIDLPPLRERRSDIPLLVRRFIQEASERNDRPFVGISAEAMEILQQHAWPGNIRELRNLVESMVILAPGREIHPSDIPSEVRGGTGRRALLPARIPAAGEEGGSGAVLRPQLEFIFRTLVELRVDMDDLRKEFEEYRAGIPGGRHAAEIGVLPGPRAPAAAEIGAFDRGAPGSREPGHGTEAGDAPARDAGGEAGPRPEHGAESDARSGAAPAGAYEAVGGGGASPGGAPGPAGGGRPEGVVVFRPGMTMEELECAAIVAALAEVDGNRRRAAELLGIGERTLYRKIRKFGLEG
ncbi:MAG: sigma 54-interacting transcriptional regulator [Longimicrobiales bacterium]|nr:sigma 54-interacting transcriptional regulator [Longimicrobiales bacterium]